MATYDSEVVQAIYTIGEDIGAMPVPHHDSMPDTMPVEGIGSAAGSGAEVLRDIPYFTRENPD